MTSEEYQRHLTMVKLIVTSQLIVEFIDDLKTTTAYRQDIKFHAKNLADKLEKTLTESYKFIDGKKDEEEAYLNVERGFRKMLNITVDELYDIGEKAVNS